MDWWRTTSTASRVVGSSIGPALAGVTLFCMPVSGALVDALDPCPMRSFDHLVMGCPLSRSSEPQPLTDRR